MNLSQIFFEQRATQVENCTCQGQYFWQNNKSASETPGAQLHVLSNITVILSNTFWATCDTYKLKNANLY
jgi:hypothetical protein